MNDTLKIKVKAGIINRNRTFLVTPDPVDN